MDYALVLYMYSRKANQQHFKLTNYLHEFPDRANRYIVTARSFSLGMLGREKCLIEEIEH
jgi:hypothetical protein